jgi:hypothetical protein
MKKQTRRLNLSRETLGQLDSRGAALVAGGRPNTDAPGCQSGLRCIAPPPPPDNTMA